MCGVAGIIELNGGLVNPIQFSMILTSMRHRGPDDEGSVLIETSTGLFEERGGPDTPKELTLEDLCIPSKIKADLVLGNRRLSIIDLSINGHQPQNNEQKTVWIVFNGEIYNYRELAEELRHLGHVFKSDSDTEVLAHGYEEWSIEGLLYRMSGMWAFALWDQRLKKLFLARDRFGIKPLFYQIDKEQMVFASEIKAIRKVLPSEVNRRRISEFLWFKPYSSDETFFQGVNQVKAAHYIELDLYSKNMKQIRYWDLTELNTTYEETNLSEVAESWYQLFEQSIRLHLRSDVPVGTCLSGGLDSSSIVCVSQKLLTSGTFTEKGLEKAQSIKTFSSIPEEKRISEAEYIEDVIMHCGVEPFFTTPTYEDFIQDFDRLIDLHDEPFRGPSIYMQYRVFRLAKENGIKVLLDGQGADEMLAGYQRYFKDYLKDIAREQGYLKAIREFIRIRDIVHLETVAPMLLRNKLGIRRRATANVVKVRPPPDRPLEYPINNLAERMRYDLFAGSIMELLKYEDTNSMIFSIESRVPFLFHSMVEFLFKQPMSAKLKNGWTKLVLREAMKDILPENVRTRRTKLGFPAPDDEWAKKLIREKMPWLKEAIESAKEFIDPQGFQELCHRVLSKGWSEDLLLFWRILVLSRWLRIINEVGNTT